MEQEALYFDENSITKSAFHKNKKQININEVDIKYLFKLNTDIKVIFFHYYYP